jgi:hypothetical protein
MISAPRASTVSGATAAALPAGRVTDQFTTIRRADRHQDWNEFLPMSNPSLATKVQFV